MYTLYIFIYNKTKKHVHSQTKTKKQTKWNQQTRWMSHVTPIHEKKNAYNLYKLSQTLTKEENENSQNDSAKLGRTYRVV